MATTESPAVALTRRVREKLDAAIPLLQLPPDWGPHITSDSTWVGISIKPSPTRPQQCTISPSICPPINEIYKILCTTAEPDELTRISIHINDWVKTASISAFCPPIHLPPGTNSNPPTVVLRALSIKSPGELLNTRFQNLTEFYFLSHSKVLDNYDLGESLAEFLRGCPYLEIANFDYYPGFKKYYQYKPISLDNLGSFTQNLRNEPSGVNPISLFNQLLLPSTCNVLLTDEDDYFERPWNVSFPISHHFSQNHSHIELVDILVFHKYGPFGRTNHLEVTAEFLSSYHKIILIKVVLERKYSHKIIKEILDFLEIEGIKGSVKTLKFFCWQDQMKAPEGVLKRVKAIAESSWKHGHPLRKVDLVVKDKSSLNNRCKELMDSLREQYVNEVSYR